GATTPFIFRTGRTSPPTTSAAASWCASSSTSAAWWATARSATAGGGAFTVPAARSPAVPKAGCTPPWPGWSTPTSSWSASIPGTRSTARSGRFSPRSSRAAEASSRPGREEATALISPRIREVLKIGRDLGLDFYDLVFEVIPWDVMNEIAAYGLPIRAHHWSYGRVYQRQRVHGRMGLSKIYEIVLNNDPAYAFLLDTNTEVENLLIVAHVAAHADFFKNNACFEGTNRNMVNEAAAHAVRIEQYKEEYGIERVERLMDAAFALERHVDPYKGLYREEYPKRT